MHVNILLNVCLKFTDHCIYLHLSFKKLTWDFLLFSNNLLGLELPTCLSFSPMKGQTHLFSKIPMPDSTNAKSQGKQKHNHI